jgi:hypothetical protein
MLKANVGLSRKVSENFNSTGFSLNLEGEILAPIDDPEAVIQRIRELYDVADEALQRQIEAHQSDSAIASRDADPPSHPEQNDRSHDRPHSEPDRSSLDRNGKPRNDEPATNKQVQFLITLAKRRRLFGAKLEAFIEEVTGRRSTPYDLNKREAGSVIDQLSGEESESNRPRR